MSPRSRRLVVAAVAALFSVLSFPARSEIELSGAPFLEADVVTVPRAEYAPPFSTFYRGGSYGGEYVGVAAGGLFFFVMEDETHGAELWKTDGTAAGTAMVKDIWPGPLSSSPEDLAAHGGLVYFRAYDMTHGSELWVSDGTPGGTRMVRDISPGPFTSYPEHLTSTAGFLFFAADDGVHGTELWRTDGTEAGTVLVKDIHPGAADSYLWSFDSVAIGSTLYFTFWHETYGYELWKSDGSAAGTALVKDIYPGAGSSYPFSLTEAGGLLFFSAMDAGHGHELWRTDGTAAGTALVKDILPGADGSSPAYLTEYGGALIFAAADGVHGNELWKSDGTPAGTVLVKDVYPGADYSWPTTLTKAGGILYFTAYVGSIGRELWKSDGTAGGTVLVRDISPEPYWSSSPYPMVDVGGTLVFVADDGVHGQELWKSDGTWAGTTLLRDIEPGIVTSSPGLLAATETAAYFLAENEASGRELWRSDGTVAGTAMVVDHESSSSWPAAITDVDGTIFFAAESPDSGRELQYRDAGGTVHLVDIQPGTGSSMPTNLTRAGGRLFFLADDGIHGRELWTCDTTGAAVLLADLAPGSDDSGAAELTDAGGTLFFLQGDMLWKSDGTPGGTVAVAPAWYTSELEAVGSTVYFSHYDAAHGEELWKSDGTAAGTVRVKDIAVGKGGSYPRYLTNVAGILYFAADDGVVGDELWKSNGTAAGTVLVKDVRTGAAGSDPSDIIVVGRRVFFWAYRPTDGYELWTSDGAAKGTVRVKDIWPGAESSYSGVPPCAVGSTLVFVAFDGVHGLELWRSDGTAAGTTLVADIVPGPDSSIPLWLTPVNGLVFFQAWESASGSELWVSDGTTDGTRVVADVNPGTASSSPSNLEDLEESTWWSRRFALSGGRLFFSAYDESSGHELWSLGAVAPAIWSQSATGLGPVWVTLQGAVAPGGILASGYFEYGESASYGETTASMDLGSGAEATMMAADVTGLACDTEYHFRTVATNGDWTVRGADTSFRTSACSVFQLDSAAYSVGEAGPVAKIKVTRTGGTAGGVTVDYATSDGSATAGADYGAVAGTLTFAEGQAAQSVTVPILVDALDEANETVAFALHSPGPGAMLGAITQTTLTIVDDDAGGVLQFNAASYSVGEGAGLATVTVSRTAGVADGVSVAFATADESALAGKDYAETAGVLTFGAGVRSQTFTVPILDDAIGEDDETLSLVLHSPGGGATLGAASTARLTIREDEVVLQFGAPALSVSEGVGAAKVTVKRTGSTQPAVSVQYETRPGTATPDADYKTVSGSLAFAAGVTVRTFSLPVVNDSIDEVDETVLLSLFGPESGAVLGPRGSAVLAIADNDSGGTVGFTAEVYAVTEGAGATVTVVRTAGTASGASVHYATTSGGTADVDVDYTPVEGTLTFAAGETKKTFAVPTLPDDASEGPETVLVALDSPAGGATLGSRTSTTVKISDAEPYVAFGKAVYEAPEGAALPVTVRRFNSTAAGETVSYALVHGTTSDDDVSGGTGTVTFAAGVTSVSLKIVATNDTVVEGTESATVVLTSSSLPLTSATSTQISILDDDAGGSIHFAGGGFSAVEGSDATIKVTRDGGLASGVSVHYASVAGGTATESQDYTPVDGTLTFGAGQATKTIVVPTLGDDLSEGRETVFLALDTPTGGATLGTTSNATLTIADAEPYVALGAPEYSATEGQAFGVTVRRFNSTAAGISVTYACAHGTTVDGDLTGAQGTVRFKAGVTSVTLKVAAANDAESELPETATLSLTTASLPIAEPGSATLIVRDNDSGGTIQFAKAGYSVSESATTAAVKVVRSGSRKGGTSVAYRTTTGGSANAWRDFTPVAGTLTFAADQTARTFKIPLIGDRRFEPDETIEVILEDPAPEPGTVLGTRSTALVTIADDDPGGTLQFSSPTLAVSEAGIEARVEVRRTGGTADAVTVDYATSDGTAHAGSDYTTVAGTLVFAAGEKTKTILVPITDDSDEEGDEILSLTLTNPTGGSSLGETSTTTLWIVDDHAGG